MKSTHILPRSKLLAGTIRLICLAVMVPIFLSCVSAVIADDSITKSDTNPKIDSVPIDNVNDHVPRAKILRFSAEIDELVEKQLAAQGQAANPLTDDQTFVRRVYLDIIGRIPTRNETLWFLKSDNPRKRAKLIDDLLNSNGYASHHFNYFADLLRIKDRMQQIPGQPYIDYVKQSLHENKPYDQFVRELLTASGPALQRGNGATGYYLRDFGMPEDNMSNTVRIFLGTRLECAQCHDHPFDNWTQRDYFEMVAFTGGVRTRLEKSDLPPQVQEIAKSLFTKSTDVDRETRRVLQKIIEPVTYGVSGGGTGLARLPENFLGSDGESLEIVKAKTMFGQKSLVPIEIPSESQAQLPERFRKKAQAARFIPGATDVGSREAYARWLTAPDNPRFATVIANRLWKRAMGIGLIEPVDDLTDRTVPSNPALMEYLTRLMVKLNFDVKQYLRVIHNTTTYQRQVTKTDIASPEKYNFPGPQLRRMSGEQLWDSLVTLTVPHVDNREGYKAVKQRYAFGDIYESYEALLKMSADDIMQRATAFVSGDRKSLMPGGKAMNKLMEANNEQRKEIMERADRLREKYVLAKRNKDEKAMRRLGMQREQLMEDMRELYGNMALDMVRASELPSPAPPGHFVREFGQSDREQIEHSNTDPAVTQVLSLMNGFIEQRVANDAYTVLMKNVAAEKTPEGAIETVFLTILSRYPTRSEKQMWLADAKNHPKEATRDLIWTLANTSEFMFIR